MTYHDLLMTSYKGEGEEGGQKYIEYYDTGMRAYDDEAQAR
jgi:hypothetical protein